MPTVVSYIGKVPPKACVALVYKAVPEFAGSGGGTPVTPVPGSGRASPWHGGLGLLGNDQRPGR